MVYFLENNNFPRFQRGSTFYGVGWRGSNFFTGGGGRPNANFRRNLSKL